MPPNVIWATLVVPPPPAPSRFRPKASVAGFHALRSIVFEIVLVDAEAQPLGCLEPVVKIDLGHPVHLVFDRWVCPARAGAASPAAVSTFSRPRGRFAAGLRALPASVAIARTATIPISHRRWLATKGPSQKLQSLAQLLSLVSYKSQPQ